MLPPNNQYQIQKTIVPTKREGKDVATRSSGDRNCSKGRTVRFRSICEEFEVTPSRESSPVCDIEREHLPGGSDIFQKILKEFHSPDDSADDSAFSEAEGSSTLSKPKKSILKRRQVERLCRQKGKCKK